MIRRLFLIAVLLISFLGFYSCERRELREGIPNFKWIEECGAKSQVFNDTIIYVNDFGVQTDTSVLSTKGIQEAIDVCAAMGGGTVSFRPGNYRLGSIFIKSGVNLNIPEGVVLYGSRQISDYPIIKTRVAGIEMNWPAALITAVDQHNIAISGKGSINGQGKTFWDKYWNMRRDYDRRGLRWIVDYDCIRPRLVLIQKCSEVKVSEINLYEAGFWSLHLLYSSYVTVDGITIDNNNAGKGPSTDGIDIDSSNRILIQNCKISCNDDNICLKAGRDADGLRVNIPTEYVVIRNCLTHFGGGLMVIGSETSGSIRHVVAYDLEAIGTNCGINFKSAYTRGGVIEDLYVADVKMTGIRNPIQLNMNWNPSYSYSKLPEEYELNTVPEHWKVLLVNVPEELGIPKFRNIHITNLKATHSMIALMCYGAEKSTMDNFYLKNIQISAARAGRIFWAKDWNFENVEIISDDKEEVDIQSSINVPLYQ